MANNDSAAISLAELKEVSKSLQSQKDTNPDKIKEPLKVPYKKWVVKPHLSSGLLHQFRRSLCSKLSKGRVSRNNTKGEEYAKGNHK